MFRDKINLSLQKRGVEPPVYGPVFNHHLHSTESCAHHYLLSTWETMFSLEHVSLCTFGHLPDYIGESWQELCEFIISLQSL